MLRLSSRLVLKPVMSEAKVKQSVLIFGHADGDGHLAAEQSRENLEKDGYQVLKVIADPAITRGCKFWETHFQTYDFGKADLIVVIDIMFDRQMPRRSYDALVNRCNQESGRRFIVIDHHPTKGLPARPDNLEVVFSKNVYTCCYGPPSELMVIASICDNDEGPVQHLITDTHRKRALGIKRAVSDRLGMAGELSLKLLKARSWDIFEHLADEPSAYHRTMYGNRIDQTPISPILFLTHLARGLA